MGPEGSARLWEKAPFDRRMEDGLAVRLRPIVPQDRDRIHRAYALLSEESRYNRFWERPSRLRESHVERLTSVDGRDHVAWLVLDPQDESFPGFGGASFWRETGNPSRAEIAFTIADAWQRRGLATLLFSILWFEGWQEGVRGFSAHCRRENRAMLAWWEDMGGTVVEEPRQFRLFLELEEPTAFLERIAFDIRPTFRLIEVAGWLRNWCETVG